MSSKEKIERGEEEQQQQQTLLLAVTPIPSSMGWGAVRLLRICITAKGNQWKRGPLLGTVNGGRGRKPGAPVSKVLSWGATRT